MSGFKIVNLVAIVALMAAGQILFKLASHHLNKGNLSYTGLFLFLLNPYLVVAIVIYGFTTLLWVWVLRDMELSRAYPFVALTFVIVPSLSAYLFGERITWSLVAGTLLIMSGVAVIAMPPWGAD